MKNTLRLTVLFLILPAFHLTAQDSEVRDLLYKANIHGESAEYEQTIRLIEEALDLQLELNPKNDTALGYIQFMLGRTLSLTGSWHESKEALEQSAAYYEKGYGRNHWRTGDAIYSIGKHIAMTTENYDSAKIYLEESIEIYESANAPLDKAWAYRQVGEYYQKQGLYQKALKSNQQATLILSTLKDSHPKIYEKRWHQALEQLGYAYFNLAKLHAIINDFEQSLYYAEQGKTVLLSSKDSRAYFSTTCDKKTAELLELLGEDEESLAIYQALMKEGEDQEAPVEKREFYLKMSDLAEAIPDYTLAAAYLDSAYMESEKISYQDSTRFFSIDLERGALFNAKKNGKAAISVLKPAYAFYAMRDFKEGKIKASTELSKAYLLEKEYQKALEINSTVTKELPSKSSQVMASVEYANLLADRAYLLSQNSDSLRSAAMLFEKSIQILKDFEAQVFSQNTFLGQYALIYERYLNLLFQQYGAEPDSKILGKAFELFERSKANALLAASSWNNHPDLPEEIVQREEQIQANLIQLRKNIFDADKTADQEKIENWQVSILQNLEKLEILKKEIKQDYPGYYESKYDSKTINLAKAKQLITAEENAIINFFTGNDYCFILFLTKTKTDFLRIPFSQNLQKDIKSFRQQISLHPSKNGGFKKSMTSIAKLGDAISQVLLQGVLQNFKPAIKSLTIIPDGPLAFIPFEVLKNPQSQNYLLEDFTISYAYSASFLEAQLKRKTGRAAASFAGFAPNYNNENTTAMDTLGQTYYSSLVRSGLSQLPGARKEVEQIAALFDGEIFYQ